MSPQRFLLEVCVASVDDALIAAEAGADRLELNFALELGGLTPSLGLLAEVKKAVGLPVIAMSRPRGGEFYYGDREKAVILRDTEWLLAHGADGIACGALTSDRQIDVALWRKIVQLAGDRETVFHRAFDELADQAAAIATLVDLGTRRVLTSGGAATALAGSAQLARLIRRAGTGIEVLPAAGVSAEHIAQLIHATGCRQVHGSFLDRQLSTWRTSRSRVVAARAALDAL